MSNALLIAERDGHRRAYPLFTVRVRTTQGDGRLVNATDDGWLAVQLDGETRVDEYPLEHCQVLAA